MAATIDAVASAQTNGSSTCSVSLTIASGATGLAVGIQHHSNRSVSSIAWNGTETMTLFRSFIGTMAGLTDGLQVDIYTLAAPTSGAHSVLVTMSASTGDLMVGAISILGGDSTVMYHGADSEFTTVSALSLALTGGTTNDIAFAISAYVPVADITPGTGVTERWDLTGTATNHGWGATKAGAASVTIDGTLSVSDNQVMTGGYLKAASASAPTLSTISPNTGNAGTTVSATLTGTNFESGMTITVSGSGVAASVTTFTSTSSVVADFVISGGAALGARTVSVTTTGGTSGPQNFTVTSGPVITSVSPNTAGIPSTTTGIAIVGTGFASTGLAVSITPSTNLTISNVIFVSSTSVTFDLVVASGAASGNRTLKTTQTTGGDSNTKTFTIGAAPSGGGGSAINFTGGTAIKFS